MKKSKAGGGALSMRVPDETTFQASILALHAAIEAAGKADSSERDELPLPSLVQRARRLAGSAESLERLDPRGF